ncbi:MAG TPA: response regulator [Thermoguttaceae bacterium]|nr:response regulator [Thermoguttaceae bacterium]
MSVPLVLLVTKHEEFASAVCEQLSGRDFAVKRLSPNEACQSHRFRDCCPDVAFVDCEANTRDGLPVYQAIKTVLHDCRIILICTMDQAPAAVRMARLWEVFDYVLIDSVRDPDRIPLLVERARTNCLPEPSEIQGHTKLQLRHVLETLGELRLADLVCGRLKRLENEIPASADKSARVSTGPTSTRILVVEDDAISGAMAKHILERNGFEAIVAETVADAKAALIRHPPALVLMDIHLGNANGLRLIKALRIGHTCPDVPIVIVTSDRMQDTVREAAGLKVQGYLLKPYQPHLLVGKVKAVLAESSSATLDAVAEGRLCES